MEIPEKLPEDADPVFAAFYNYYAKRARHPRAVNFVDKIPFDKIEQFFQDNLK